MMEKIYDDLIELYHNSGKEFFQEMVALLKHRFPLREHTVLIRGEAGEWKLGASSLAELDEAVFLLHIAETEFIEKEGNCVKFSKNRPGVLAHIAIPLFIKGKYIAGIWIMETTKKGGSLTDTAVVKTAAILAILIQSVQNEKICIYNRYLDADTNFPGRKYFCYMLERLKKKQHKVLVAAIREKDYREKMCSHGSMEILNETNELADIVSEMNLGNVFTIAEDTFAVISVEAQAELFAHLEQLIYERGYGKSLKGIILNPFGYEDVLKELEQRFSLCADGNILLPDMEKGNPMLRLFSEEQKDIEPNSLQRTKEQEEDSGGDEELEFLSMLEQREYL